MDLLLLRFLRELGFVFMASGLHATVHDQKSAASIGSESPVYVQVN